MDSLETNKAFAAVLVAGLAFVGSGVIANFVVKPTELHETAIKIDIPEAAGAAAPEQPDPPVALLLASADVGRGEGLVKSQGCVACHSFNEGGKNGVGPNLWNTVGNKHGHMPGFAYSAALTGKAGPWQYDELSEWLKKPSAYAPGTKMSYAGLADPKKRADIILYLHSLSKTPVPLPPVPAAAAAPAAGAVAGAGAAPGGGAPGGAAPGGESIDARLASADVETGKTDTMKLGCVACHTYTKGGRAGIGPNMWDVVGADIGKHMEGYQYSAALSKKGGKWTYAELDEWLTKPAAFAPGTKMTFAGVANPKQRADLIAYLRTLADDPVPLPGK